ncbi:hypothetical protein H6F67_21215 [Microcoleus sp. FACHB-1515]|uniref:hypothetical protein n=1 Tax=Cyanophyceae TaxID=3028117 RepID=UPI0016832C65|nr:hypothetical protein [Microcoleus sp. FACHB-1515]MBD2092373.1 hypothetical protein [Microcoleus sp. FACHB-1515]
MARNSNNSNSNLTIESFFITLLAFFAVLGLLQKTGAISNADVQQANPLRQPQVQSY